MFYMCIYKKLANKGMLFNNSESSVFSDFFPCIILVAEQILTPSPVLHHLWRTEKIGDANLHTHTHAFHILIPEHLHMIFNQNSLPLWTSDSNTKNTVK